MKRLIMSCLWGMVFIILGFSQTQEGRATWYNTEAKGLAASHLNLPFGTRVRVTNLQNNRQVIVTIDNRIPESADRILDISKAAAENLEMNPRGATPVRIEVLARRQSDELPEEEIAESSPEQEQPDPSLPIVEVKPDPANGQPGSGMVNQTIITFNGMPNYSFTPSTTSSGGMQTAAGSGPVLTAQEVPAPAPIRPEPVLQSPAPAVASPAPAVASPAPAVASPAPAIASPQPMVMQPTVMQPVVVQPVVVPPVITPPILAEPVLAEPVLAEPVLAEPVVAAPVTAAPVSSQPILTEPAAVSPRTVPMVSSEPQVTRPIITEPVRTSPTYTVPPYESAPSVRTPDIRAPSPPQQTYDPRFIQVLPRVPDPGNGRIYRLQVGAFTNEINAREAVFRLRELGFDPVYELYGGYCRVIITGIRSGDVTAIIQRLGSAGFDQIFIREDP